MLRGWKAPAPTRPRCGCGASRALGCLTGPTCPTRQTALMPLFRRRSPQVPPVDRPLGRRLRLPLLLFLEHLGKTRLHAFLAGRAEVAELVRHWRVEDRL